MKKGLFPGTFDPPSLGHLEIIERASTLCETLYVAVAENLGKANSPFSFKERKQLIEVITASLGNVTVISFSGLAVDCAKKIEADFIVRGLRNCSDFDYEFQMAASNRQMTGIETIFLAASPKYVHISGTLIREIAKYGGRLHDFVPEVIEEQVLAAMQAWR